MMIQKLIVVLLLNLCVIMTVAQALEVPAAYRDAVYDALERALNNEDEIEEAFRLVEAGNSKERTALAYLVSHMPKQDLRKLTGEFLANNVRLALKAREETTWGESIPVDIFLNDVLPYANLNERRDDWREDFYERFFPLVKDSKSPEEAAQILNRDIWDILDVHYHATKRPKPDQSPYESIEASYASCSGLSILLINACRAVGVPARFVGIPEWANKEGNHSWVEIWDGENWQYTGAAEYDSGGLGRAWFAGDAAKAIKSEQMNSIYATSWKPADSHFPLIWDSSIKYVNAINVTDRYTGKVADRVFIQVFTLEGGPRVSKSINVYAGFEVVASGVTKDATSDNNDMLGLELQPGKYELEIVGQRERKTFTVAEGSDEEHRFYLRD